MKQILLLILATSVGATSTAQAILTNNDAVMSTTDGVIMTIQGNAFNNGTFSNEGAMRLHGDWTNDGRYRSVSGTFSLLGTSQIIEPGTDTYPNLLINNGGTAVLSDWHVSQSIELNTGIVSFATNARLLIHEYSNISGGNETSYIDGPMFISGTGDFFFPIGTSSEYLPVSLFGAQTSDSVGVQAFSESLLVSNTTNLDAFSENRYWHIIGGSDFTSSSILLPVVAETFVESSEEAVVAFTADLETSPLEPLASSLSGSIESGTITATSPINAGYFVIADASLSNPPITVINLVTSLQDGKHDFLRIENIEFYEKNFVEIFDRQGIKVFEMNGYDNQDRAFRGNANVGSRGVLETGSYYFTIQLNGSNREAGFIYVKN